MDTLESGKTFGEENFPGKSRFHLRRIGPQASKTGVENIMDFHRVTSLIGRNREHVDFLLDSSNKMASQYISRLHARVVRQENDLHCMYDDSMNGIFINNTKISGSVILKEGDKVTFGHPYGVTLAAGVWKRQPDSEYQFIFEKCTCSSPKKMKPAALEDKINVAHYKAPLVEPLLKPVRLHAPDIEATLTETKIQDDFTNSRLGLDQCLRMSPGVSERPSNTAATGKDAPLEQTDQGFDHSDISESDDELVGLSDNISLCNETFATDLSLCETSRQEPEMTVIKGGEKGTKISPGDCVRTEPEVSEKSVCNFAACCGTEVSLVHFKNNKEISVCETLQEPQSITGTGNTSDIREVFWKTELHDGSGDSLNACKLQGLSYNSVSVRGLTEEQAISDSGVECAIATNPVKILQVEVESSSIEQRLTSQQENSGTAQRLTSQQESSNTEQSLKSRQDTVSLSEQQILSPSPYPLKIATRPAETLHSELESNETVQNLFLLQDSLVAGEDESEDNHLAFNLNVQVSSSCDTEISVITISKDKSNSNSSELDFRATPAHSVHKTDCSRPREATQVQSLGKCVSDCPAQEVMSGIQVASENVITTFSVESRLNITSALEIVTESQNGQLSGSLQSREGPFLSAIALPKTIVAANETIIATAPVENSSDDIHFLRVVTPSSSKNNVNETAITAIPYKIKSNDNTATQGGTDTQLEPHGKCFSSSTAQEIISKEENETARTPVLKDTTMSNNVNTHQDVTETHIESFNKCSSDVMIRESTFTINSVNQTALTTATKLTRSASVCPVQGISEPHDTKLFDKCLLDVTSQETTSVIQVAAITFPCRTGSNDVSCLQVVTETQVQNGFLGAMANEDISDIRAVNKTAVFTYADKTRLEIDHDNSRIRPFLQPFDKCFSDATPQETKAGDMSTQETQLQNQIPFSKETDDVVAELHVDISNTCYFGVTTQETSVIRDVSEITASTLQAPGSDSTLQGPGSGSTLQSPGSGSTLQGPGSGSTLRGPGSGNILQGVVVTDPHIKPLNSCFSHVTAQETTPALEVLTEIVATTLNDKTCSDNVSPVQDGRAACNDSGDQVFSCIATQEVTSDIETAATTIPVNLVTNETSFRVTIAEQDVAVAVIQDDPLKEYSSDSTAQEATSAVKIMNKTVATALPVEDTDKKTYSKAVPNAVLTSHYKAEHSTSVSLVSSVSPSIICEYQKNVQEEEILNSKENKKQGEIEQESYKTNDIPSGVITLTGKPEQEIEIRENNSAKLVNQKDSSLNIKLTEKFWTALPEKNLQPNLTESLKCKTPVHAETNYHKMSAEILKGICGDFLDEGPQDEFLCEADFQSLLTKLTDNTTEQENPVIFSLNGEQGNFENNSVIYPKMEDMNSIDKTSCDQIDLSTEIAANKPDIGHNEHNTEDYVFTEGKDLVLSLVTKRKESIHSESGAPLSLNLSSQSADGATRKQNEMSGTLDVVSETVQGPDFGFHTVMTFDIIYEETRRIVSKNYTVEQCLPLLPDDIFVAAVQSNLTPLPKSELQCSPLLNNTGATEAVGEHQSLNSASLGNNKTGQDVSSYSDFDPHHSGEATNKNPHSVGAEETVTFSEISIKKEGQTKVGRDIPFNTDNENNVTFLNNESSAESYYVASKVNSSCNDHILNFKPVSENSSPTMRSCSMVVGPRMPVTFIGEKKKNLDVTEDVSQTDVGQISDHVPVCSVNTAQSYSMNVGLVLSANINNERKNNHKDLDASQTDQATVETAVDEMPRECDTVVLSSTPDLFSQDVDQVARIFEIGSKSGTQNKNDHMSSEQGNQIAWIMQLSQTLQSEAGDENGEDENAGTFKRNIFHDNQYLKTEKNDAKLNFLGLLGLVKSSNAISNSSNTIFTSSPQSDMKSSVSPCQSGSIDVSSHLPTKTDFLSCFRDVPNENGEHFCEDDSEEQVFRIPASSQQEVDVPGGSQKAHNTFSNGERNQSSSSLNSIKGIANVKHIDISGFNTSEATTENLLTCGKIEESQTWDHEMNTFKTPSLIYSSGSETKDNGGTLCLEWPNASGVLDYKICREEVVNDDAQSLASEMSDFRDDDDLHLVWSQTDTSTDHGFSAGDDLNMAHFSTERKKTAKESLDRDPDTTEESSNEDQKSSIGTVIDHYVTQFNNTKEIDQDSHIERITSENAQPLVVNGSETKGREGTAANNEKGDDGNSYITAGRVSSEDGSDYIPAGRISSEDGSNYIIGSRVSSEDGSDYISDCRINSEDAAELIKTESRIVNGDTREMSCHSDSDALVTPAWFPGMSQTQEKTSLNLEVSKSELSGQAEEKKLMKEFGHETDTHDEEHPSGTEVQHLKLGTSLKDKETIARSSLETLPPEANGTGVRAEQGMKKLDQNSDSRSSQKKAEIIHEFCSSDNKLPSSQGFNITKYVCLVECCDTGDNEGEAHSSSNGCLKMTAYEDDEWNNSFSTSERETCTPDSENEMHSSCFTNLKTISEKEKETQFSVAENRAQLDMANTLENDKGIGIGLKTETCEDKYRARPSPMSGVGDHILKNVNYLLSTNLREPNLGISSAVISLPFSQDKHADGAVLVSGSEGAVDKRNWDIYAEGGKLPKSLKRKSEEDCTSWLKRRSKYKSHAHICEIDLCTQKLDDTLSKGCTCSDTAPQELETFSDVKDGCESDHSDGHVSRDRCESNDSNYHISRCRYESDDSYGHTSKETDIVSDVTDNSNSHVFRDRCESDHSIAHISRERYESDNSYGHISKEIDIVKLNLVPSSSVCPHEDLICELVKHKKRERTLERYGQTTEASQPQKRMKLGSVADNNSCDRDSTGKDYRSDSENTDQHMKTATIVPECERDWDRSEDNASVEKKVDNNSEFEGASPDNRPDVIKKKRFIDSNSDMIVTAVYDNNLEENIEANANPNLMENYHHHTNFNSPGKRTVDVSDNADIVLDKGIDIDFIISRRKVTMLVTQSDTPSLASDIDHMTHLEVGQSSSQPCGVTSKHSHSRTPNPVGSVGQLLISTPPLHAAAVASSPSATGSGGFISPPPLWSPSSQQSPRSPQVSTRKPGNHRAKRRDRLHSAVLSELARLDEEIKTALEVDSPNIEEAIAALEDLDLLPINAALLEKSQAIVETVRKCQNYVCSEDVRTLSTHIYVRFKSLMDTSTNKLGSLMQGIH